MKSNREKKVLVIVNMEETRFYSILKKSISDKRSKLYTFKFHNLFEKFTVDLLGCTHELFKKRIKFQFTEDITLEKNCSIWNSDHRNPCFSFEISAEKQYKTFI